MVSKVKPLFIPITVAENTTKTVKRPITVGPILFLDHAPFIFFLQTQICHKSGTQGDEHIMSSKHEEDEMPMDDFFGGDTEEEDVDKAGESDSDSEFEPSKTTKDEGGAAEVPEAAISVERKGKIWVLNGEPKKLSDIRRVIGREILGLPAKAKVGSDVFEKHKSKIIASLTGKSTNAKRATAIWKEILDEVKKVEAQHQKRKDTQEENKLFKDFQQTMGPPVEVGSTEADTMTVPSFPSALNTPNASQDHNPSPLRKRRAEEPPEVKIEEEEAKRPRKGDPFIMLSESVNALKENNVKITVKGLKRSEETFTPREIVGMGDGPTSDFLGAVNVLEQNGFKVDYEIGFEF
jgi:hypothetical protein